MVIFLELRILSLMAPIGNMPFRVHFCAWLQHLKSDDGNKRLWKGDEDSFITGTCTLFSKWTQSCLNCLRYTVLLALWENFFISLWKLLGIFGLRRFVAFGPNLVYWCCNGPSVLENEYLSPLLSSSDHVILCIHFSWHKNAKVIRYFWSKFIYKNS